PRTRAAALNGYAIGRYPTNDPHSAPPQGFIEVTRANADTPVSPHFRLRAFLCKQSGDFRKSLLLPRRLPANLEPPLDPARRCPRSSTPSPTARAPPASTRRRSR